jgi:hypothetical protein
MWQSLFSYSFNSSLWYLFWHSLVLHSFNITTPSWSEEIYKCYSIFPLTIRPLSPSLFSFSSFAFLFNKSVYFSYNHIHI